MEKLTVREKLGYGSGSLGDAAAYAFIGTFLMFFLTTVAKIEPATAGILTAIGAIWNALFNPIMGFCSDRVNTRFGKRRPVILAFSIPLAITIFLLFSNFDLPDRFKAMYYGIMLMLFWTCYTGFFVPYLALGVEYTSDYDDRTVLRLFASFFNSIGSILSTVMPTLLVKYLIKHGVSLDHAWSVTGAAIGIIAAISIIITVAVSGNKDKPQNEPSAGKNRSFNLKTIFTEYISVAKLSPVKYLVIASITSLIAYQLILSDLIYFFTYNMGLSATKISFMLLLRSVIGIILIPVVGKIALAIDKRGTMIFFFAIAAVGMCVLRFTGIAIMPEVLIYMVFVCCSTCIYWDLMPSIYYDICEYDQLENGKNRQGTIVSFQGLVEAVALGIGSLILGVLLQLAGFDGDALRQTKTAMEWIFNCTTVVPVIFLIIASVAIYQYPITKEIHEDIKRKLKDR